MKRNKNVEFQNKMSIIDIHIVNIGDTGRLRRVTNINNISNGTVPKCISGTMQAKMTNGNHFLSNKKRKSINMKENAHYHLIKFSAHNAENAIILGKNT